MGILETRKLSYSYRAQNVIEDITFSVEAGERWAVIGRNGAGKSTLIKCLCGLLPLPQNGSGAITLDGENIANLTPRKIAKKIAYIPQGVNRTPPPFTVREYLTLARYPYCGAWKILSAIDKQCVEDALAITNTMRLANRKMDTLSGGELQSALIAGALAQNTPLLLFDEPTTHLDPCHQENVREIIERVCLARGATVITVTHDVNFALATHDNILSLADGKMFFCGSKESFCANAHENLFKIFSVKYESVKSQNQKTFYFTAGGGS